MVISIVNHKGGTGKTTTTVNLGSALAAKGKKILVVDFDAQASLSYSLGIDERAPSIADVLLQEKALPDIKMNRENMDILPANGTLADVELAIAHSKDRFSHLKNLLACETPGYDFILIDCTPSLSLLTLNALCASDYLLVPMQMDVLALRGLDSLTETIAKIRGLNPNLSILGILPVMVDIRKNMHQEIIHHIQANYTTRIFRQAVRTCVKAAEAPSFGKSVLKYAPLSTAALDYTVLAEEVLHIVSQSQIRLSQVQVDV